HNSDGPRPSRYGPRSREVKKRQPLIVALALACNLALAGAVAGVLAAAGAVEPVRVLAFGDSLTAGYGLPAEDGFGAQPQRAPDGAGVAAPVLDGGVAGETSAGGLARLDWALADQPDAVILELGANDGLRGIDPASTRANIEAMLSRLAEAGTPV